MDVFNYEIWIGLCCVDKNIKRLFWLQHQSCTERDTWLYKSARKFNSVPSKEIIQKLLCDPQNEHVRFWGSQCLVKCTYCVTVPVRAFILINANPKTNLHKCNGLKYAVQFWRNCGFKFFVSLNIKKLVSEASKIHAVFMRNVRWCYWIVNTIVTGQGITVNIRNMEIYNNAFSISPVVIRRWTDKNVQRNQNTHFCCVQCAAELYWQ